ncbi:hypothetical protein BDZ94DRAFT_1257356 [Collybia nuda]|uniref:F-box domain-containing protein n=1 Tax=Collybia nuda TaxID=64659 RepID=A0A9P6CFI3_9AGAR|nr:hypothetical protein BDZ94DRAFT_1257356 [Collybia nuda]
MISTRRRSAKHEITIKYDKPHTTNEDDPTNPTSESEGEGSDWEPNWSSKNKRNPNKRTRLSMKPSSSGATHKNSRIQKSLSLLITMPLDILFEILGLLSPRDLVNLARTSKPLRETLIARHSTTVWKSARKNVGCPDCPSDFSELKWASLLFGTKCQVCSAPGVLRIDFFLRRRACVACRKSNLVVKSKFPVVFPDYDPVILDFVPYTNVGGWAHGHSSGSKFYWVSDVDNVARQWGLLQKDLHMRLVGARKRIDEFRATMIDLVATIIKNADTYDTWARSVAAQKRSELYEIRDKRYESIVDRFTTLGYTKSEVRSISWQKECLRGGELTERVWKRIQPILEPQIREHRKARILAAHEAIVEQRKTILKDMYKSYLKTLQPSQWLYHPRSKELTEFSVFEPLINADDEVTVDNASFQEPMSMLPGLISTWSEQRMANLRNKITSVAQGNGITSIDPVHLATSIFQCGNSLCGTSHTPWRGCSNLLFAWEGAVTHHCKTNDFFFAKDLQTELVFSEKGSRAAEQLISLIGLNPTSSTTADMDQLDPRFFCSLCTPIVSHGRPVYSWRSGVAHFISHNHPTDPSWELLTTGQATVVKLLEAPDPIQNNPCWTCNHCNMFFDSWQPRQTVVEHLSSGHGISDYREPRDLFHFPNLRRSFVAIPFYNLPSSD